MLAQGPGVQKNLLGMSSTPRIEIKKFLSLNLLVFELKYFSLTSKINILFTYKL